ncbi:hypothetical protein Lsed01_00560 [Demequina sediminis]|uniref:Uncharacterized protein n=1 Tax=Demequina sediminis TaxID=1930058 RepID=A0ABP9WGA1_9MICO|nr:hypothetical protein [Demequina sediminis]BDZ61920.1 hypothetical protein GCM10025873_17110 [Demequina sediminis]
MPRSTEASPPIYAVASAGGIASLLFARWLGRLDPGSDLIAAERAQWHAGGLRSLIAAGRTCRGAWSATASMGLPCPRVRATTLGLKVYLDVWASVELTARAEPEPEPGAA